MLVQSASDDEHDSEAAPNRFATARPSIVVLPFESDLADDAAGDIARGIVHDLITRIARSRALFVIARGTSFHFASGNRDIGSIGAELGVRYAVQGAIRLSGSKLTVVVGLAETSTRAELWSERFDRRRDDFMQVQEEILEQIVSCLEAEIVRNEIRRSMLMPSSNLDAWSAYHRGVHHMYRFTDRDCDFAEELFRRSIAMEPGVPRPQGCDSCASSGPS